jgi:hypothetical protein
MSSAGRDTIITENVLNAFNKVLNSDMNAIILTDAELVFLVNKELSDDEKFSYSSFQRWKTLFKKQDDCDEQTAKYLDKYDEILSIIKDALITQKNNLFREFREDKQTWTKWAWIIERKFDEWNLRTKSENINRIDNLNKVEVEIINKKDEPKIDIDLGNGGEQEQSSENNA